MTDDEPLENVSEDRVTVRRAPRYPRFLILGAGFGAVLAFIGTASFPVDEEVGFGPLLGYLAVATVPVCAALGGMIAALLDFIATRRAKQYEVERTVVEAPAEGDLEGELED